MPRKKKSSENQDGAAPPDVNGSSEPPKKKRAPRRKAAKEPTAEKVDAAPQISDEAIRLRAYLIAEERARRGLPGDENSDWLEARRQLMEEG